MTRLVLGVMRALEPPLRFLLAGLFGLIAAALGVLRAIPEAGYPAPGRLGYHPPPLETLLLGFLLVGALAACRVVTRARGLAGLATMFFLSLGAAGVIEALTPGRGLARIMVLVVVALVGLRWSRNRDREDVLRSAGFLAFSLVLVKYAVLDALASEGAAGLLGLTLRSVTLGSLTQIPLPAGDEYRAALVLLCFSAAVVAQWQPLPAEAAEPLLLASGHPGGAEPAALPRAAEALALPAEAGSEAVTAGGEGAEPGSEAAG